MANQTKRLVESAVLIAIASGLSLVQIPFPFGGGITLLSMLPMVILAYRHGTLWGLGSGFVYGVLQMFLGYSTVSAFFLPGDSQMVLYRAVCVLLLDYLAAYTVLGLAGVFRSRFSPAPALALGALLGGLARYLVHILSGALFFGQWADWFFSENLGSFGAGVLERFSGIPLVLIYSSVYNGLYMIPDMVTTAVAAYLMGKTVLGKKELHL